MSSGYAQWSPTTTYVINDVVEYAGLVYQATQINTGVAPYPATPVWALIGGGGGGFVQTISLAGDTITLAPSGGSVNVGSATSVASVVAKTTAQTYDTGFAFTEFNSLVKLPELQVSDPTSANPVVIDGGNAQIQIGDVVGTAPPTIDFYTQPTANANLNFYNAIGAADASIQYSGANSKITINSDNISLDAGGGGLIEMTSAGAITFPTLPSATKSDVIYYDSATKAISFGAAGGGSTPALSAVLGVGNSAGGSDIQMNGNDILGTSTISTSYINQNSTINSDINVNNTGSGNINLSAPSGQVAMNMALDMSINLTAPGSVVRIQNGNDIITSDALNSMTIRKDGIENLYFNATAPATSGRVDTQVGAGSAQLFMGATNASVASCGLRTTITPSTGSLVEHENIIGFKPLTIKSGDLRFEAGVNSSSTAVPTLINQTAGFTSLTQPCLIQQLTTPTAGNGYFSRVNLTGHNTTPGNTLHAHSVYANDGTGVNREWSRIQTKTENVSAGNQDGTLSIFNSVNGVIQETFNFNGAQNENNSFRPLDMNGNDIRCASGSLQVGCSTSTTAGATLTLATKDNVAGSGAGLLLTGNTLLNASAGGSAGTHLCLTINGVVYKIALLNA